MERVSFDRNIVQYYGACLNEEVPLLVMEYMAVRSSLLCCVLLAKSFVVMQCSQGAR